MSSKVRKDPIRIAQDEHNPDLLAKKVQVVGTEISIAVRADENDSVQVEPRFFEFNPQSGEEFDIHNCKELCVYADPMATLEISPDGNTWVPIIMDVHNPVSVLAKKARVNASGSIIVLGRGC